MGAIPLTYALYAEASIEVIHFLFKTHRQKWGNMPFDFGDMMLGLAGKIRASASVEYMRNVICAQRIHFPDLRVDWQEIMESDDMNGFDTDIGMYRVLIEASVSSRYILMQGYVKLTMRLRRLLRRAPMATRERSYNTITRFVTWSQTMLACIMNI